MKLRNTRASESKKTIISETESEEENVKPKKMTKTRAKNAQTKQEPKTASNANAREEASSKYFSDSDQSTHDLNNKKNTMTEPIKDSSPVKLSTNKNSKKTVASSQPKKKSPKEAKNVKQKSEPKPVVPKLPDLNLLASSNCIETNVDLLLQMEKAALTSKKSNQDDEFMDDDESSSEENESTKNSDSEDGDDFEEVKMELIHDLSKVGRGKTLQVVVNDKKAKKTLDAKAKMERMLKAMQKKYFIMMLKTHLVCWLSHGFYLNKLCLNEHLRSLVLSQPCFSIQNFELRHLSKDVLSSFLKRLKTQFVDSEDQNKFLDSAPVDTESLDQSISSLKCKNYLHYILMLIIAFRNMSIKTRLCINFDTISNQEATKKKQQKVAHKNPNSKKSRAESAALKQANEEVQKALQKKSNSKRKSQVLSESDGDGSIEANAKSSKKPKTVKTRQRKSSKLAQLKLKSMGESSDDDVKPCSSKQDKDFEMAESSSEDDEFMSQVEVENSKKNTLMSQNGIESKATKLNGECIDLEVLPVRQAKNKPLVKNNKILTDDEEDGEDQKEVNEESTSSLDLSSIAYRNYWIEVYLEKERYWCAVEPVAGKLDCSAAFEKRHGKPILYVCGFDNDHRVKEVTKRYASEWATITRLQRVNHLDDKKLWWEAALLTQQPLDASLDIEEEMQLKG
jgi:xeroderma pigmentosum group C-complementing protein